MHDNIEAVTWEGTVGDEVNIVEQKERWLHHMETDMRDRGLVPVLDLDPQYTQHYNYKSNSYEFKFTVYGAYVGKEEACKTAGIMGGKKIPLYIPQPK